MNIQKVAVIAVGYGMINLFLSFYDAAIIHSPYSLGPSELYSLNKNVLTNFLIALFSGIPSGAMMVFVNGRYFRRKSFGFALFVTGVFYVAVFLIISMSIAIGSAHSNLEPDATRNEILNYASDFYFDLATFAYFILYGFLTLFTLFLLQVNDKFGPGILVKFLRGQYYQPRKEERIFMFADMRSSTTIAEKLGNAAYFNLLSDLFADVTKPILNNGGEIYQYVGDEIVISWPLEKGVDQGHCIQCFLQIQKRLKDLAPRYEKKYGVIPVLKAGLHHGEVTAGEIGLIKRDIVYSGDVLNTASRIQEQCNKYQVDFLLSKDTFDLLGDQSLFERVPLGDIELRGKSKMVELNTIKVL